MARDSDHGREEGTEDVPGLPPRATRDGFSPVVEGRDRGRAPMIMAFVVIMSVVAFLFVTAGGESATPPAPSSAPQLAASSGPLDSPGLPPPLPPAPAVPPGFPPPPVPGQTAPSERNQVSKEEARRRAPLLIYDVSGRAAVTPPVESSGGMSDVQRILEAQRLASDSGSGPADGGDERGSAAERFAERTRAFGQSAGEDSAAISTSRRIDLHSRIAQGKTIAATLETAVNSDLPGKLRAVVATDVWSEDGRQRLILRGSRLIGDYRSGLARGQSRVFVVWTRLLQPDGTDIAIGSPGTDELGRAGLAGDVDRHFFERFGAALLLSVIGSTAVVAQDGNAVIIDSSRSFSEVAGQSLQDSINIPPTVTVAQGSPVQVLVSRDLVFDRPPSSP